MVPRWRSVGRVVLITFFDKSVRSATLMRNNSSLELVSARPTLPSSCQRPRVDMMSFRPLRLTGPPLHDALTIIYLTHPHLISGPTGKLHVDISKTERDGETTFTPLVDVEGREDGQDDARNRCKVLMDLDVDGFFEVMLEVVDRADEVLARVEM